MNDVVHVSYPQPEVAVIAMEDRVNNNTFTEKLQRGIKEAVESIEANPLVKVVITHGYDNYYLCGAERKGLLELTKGEKTFADSDFYMKPLTCKVPTIAAVQGHAIGDGLSFACLHDFIFLASGVIYSANFLKYGFTPCMGSSYTIPKHFGANCGYHMLYTAKQYDRDELQSLDCLLPFYPKNEVIEHSLQLAKDISDKTMTSVKLLKEQLSAQTRRILPHIIDKEVAMQVAIMTTDEVKNRIRDAYGE